MLAAATRDDGDDQETRGSELFESLARGVIDRMSAADTRPQLSEPMPQSGAIDSLARILIDTDPTRARAHVAELLQAGIPRTTLYRRYLAEAARRLGKWWDEDEVPFSQVSIGTARICGILSELRDAEATDTIRHRVRIALTCVPGDPHFLGATMAADLLRDAGWDVMTYAGLDSAGLAVRVAEDRLDVLGLSVSGSMQLPELGRLIVDLRIACPSLRIMVGGAILAEDESLLAILGPDAVVGDVPEAVAYLSQLSKDGESATAPKG